MILRDKKGQLAILVIIAIVIIAGVLVYLFVGKGPGPIDVSGQFKPIYESYLSCIKANTKAAANLAGSQGGHIQLPDFIPGSDYAPFSSQLNFLGFPIPYWFYISGNGIVKEQIPTKQQMQKEIAAFIQSRLVDCNFDDYSSKGYLIDPGNPIVSVKIGETSITVDVKSNFVMSKGESSASKSNHEVIVNDKLGKFYRIASEIYSKERTEGFLENYSVDVLHLYAPVDGVELSCGPKIWKSREVDQGLREALEANINAIKINSNSGNNKTKYFTVPMNIDENVNLVYSKNWPTKLEISGSGVDDELMTAEPVGNQAGLGLMGFCYVPYHFVYDVSFPVLIQVYNDEEVFQFPVAVIIDKNMPVKAEQSIISEEQEFNFCQENTQDVLVNVKDVNLNAVNANISYECFGQECPVGETDTGTFVGKVPACVNGYIIARANGYEEKRQLFSSNEENLADMILDKRYDLNVSVEMNGKNVVSNAIVTFTKNDSDGEGQTYSAFFPDSKSVRLTEGIYAINVYVYSNSSLVVPGSTKTQCTDVQKTGFLGLFGGTNQQCFDIAIPDTKIDNALTGGGKTSTYIFPQDLEKGSLKLIVGKLPAPTTIEQLQANFEVFDSMDVGIEFG